VRGGSEGGGVTRALLTLCAHNRPWRMPPAPPDHFFALAVPPMGVRHLFEAAHAALAAHDARLAAHAVDADAAHVTMAVVRLADPGGELWGGAADPERLALAKAAADAAAAAIGGPLELSVDPTPRVFGPGRVLWLPVAPADRLAGAAAAVESALQEHGLEPPRRGPPPRFTPHVTVAKVAWPRRGSIPDAAWAGCLDGVAPPPPFAATSLQLCAMGNRPPGAYYEVVHEVAL